MNLLGLLNNLETANKKGGNMPKKFYLVLIIIVLSLIYLTFFQKQRTPEEKIIIAEMTEMLNNTKKGDAILFIDGTIAIVAINPQERNRIRYSAMRPPTNHIETLLLAPSVKRVVSQDDEEYVSLIKKYVKGERYKDPTAD